MTAPRGDRAGATGGRRVGNEVPSGAGAVVAGVVLLYAVQAFRVWSGAAPPLDGSFDGADSYMRLVRVLACHGHCPGGLVLRSNAPFGDILHWPFLEDRLLLAIAAPLRLVLPFREAVVVAGYLWGPLLSIALVAVVVRIAKRILPGRGYWLAALLVPTQLWVLLGFAPQAVDHHGFMAAMLVVMVAAALPALTGRYRLAGAAVGTGLALALGAWVSIEALVVAIPLVTVLGIRWIVTGRQELARFHRTLFAVAAVVLAVALLVDGPYPDRFAAEFDRFSAVHVLLFVLAALAWSVVSLVPLRSVVRRVLAAALVAAAVIGLTIAVYPGFARPPHTVISPEMFPLWIAENVENTAARRQDAVWQAIALGPLLLVLPASILRSLTGPRRQRAVWALFALMYVWFGAFTELEQIRWNFYLHVLYPVGLAAVLAGLLRAARRLRPPVVVALAHVTTLAAFALATPLTLLLLAAPAGEGAPACPAGEVAAALAPLPGGGVVLTDMFAGPEVLYRTGFDVVTTPYHRNVAGTRDSEAFMAATDDAEARRIADERGIRWVAICRDVAWYPRVRPDSAGTLYHALQTGTEPAWLRRVPPAGAGGRVVVFEVVPAGQAERSQRISSASVGRLPVDRMPMR